MTTTFHLTIRTPEGEIFSKRILSISIATEGGELQVFAHHASMTASILFSIMKIHMEEADIDYAVQQGILFVSVEDNTATLLCYSCKAVKDIEYKTAKQYLEFIEEKLRSGENLNEYQIKYLENQRIGMVQQIEILEEQKN